MQKKERISLYKALGLVGILLLTALILFLNRRPADFSYNPLERALSFYEQEDYRQATIYFAQADVMNVPEAAFALGAMNFAGKGMPVDIPKALAYYEKAAKAGYAPAQMTLALLYIHGENVVQDIDKGLKFAEEAAGNGDPKTLKKTWKKPSRFTNRLPCREISTPKRLCPLFTKTDRIQSCLILIRPRAGRKVFRNKKSSKTSFKICRRTILKKQNNEAARSVRLCPVFFLRLRFGADNRTRLF